jgi:hypothetical protein
VGKGEVEALQMVTAASAALSRDMLAFKETADRLRGLSAAPRLGAGALDPDMVLPGQAPRSAAAKPGVPAPVVRTELRDFQGLEGNTALTKRILLVVAFVAIVAALANVFYFSVPHARFLSAEAAGKGVASIETSGESAVVMVLPEWFTNVDSAVPQLNSVLREGGVKKAILIHPDGRPAGVLDTGTGKVSGLSRPRPKK